MTDSHAQSDHPILPVYDTLGRRVRAFAIDLLLVSPFLIGSRKFANASDNAAGSAAETVANILMLVYFVGLTAHSGQTVGKRAAGVSVVTEARRPVTLAHAMKRYLPAVVYVVVDAALAIPNPLPPVVNALGALGLLFAILYGASSDWSAARASSQRRALHDRLAGTVVVRKALLSVP